ncbi:unnamed protein product [Kuraishia capsulata CBS 1993]|uniref:Uncharacterized protein n=1 Tax=Kuraishia capsulata CBS 1993 TaxID=1382522 RepID=W6MLR0_9ASCO|nr:uncharacterized protein KUCA_T00001772001 [Kuraishia capsulata CBS 1993]CDK25802.1 unnamed protein product [Kuraishia capsulata CBS 1993]
MGASFRNVGEITALAGCDFLTIAPKLLEELFNSDAAVPQVLKAEDAASVQEEKVSFVDDEALFRFLLNEDAMATEKLSQGIRGFSADCVTLVKVLEEKVKA